MVGSTLSEYGNIRLQEIFDCKKPFGGKHVIAIGDFYQMKPVMDGYIFKNSGKCYTTLAPNVWCDNFKIYSLTEILCQKEEKKFCEILNRLRKAQCTEEDNRIFESRIIKKILKITILVQDTYFHLQMLWNNIIEIFFIKCRKIK